MPWLVEGLEPRPGEGRRGVSKAPSVPAAGAFGGATAKGGGAAGGSASHSEE